MVRRDEQAASGNAGRSIGSRLTANACSVGLGIRLIPMRCAGDEVFLSEDLSHFPVACSADAMVIEGSTESSNSRK